MLTLLLCTIAIVYLVTRDVLFRPVRNFIGRLYHPDKNVPSKTNNLFWFPYHLVGCYFCVGAWAHLFSDIVINGWTTDWRYVCISLLKGIVFGGVGGEILELLNNKKAG